MYRCIEKNRGDFIIACFSETNDNILMWSHYADYHIEIDYIDESEVLSLADNKYHIDKSQFSVPFVCMQLVVEGVFVGSEIFKSGNPEKRAAIFY